MRIILVHYYLIKFKRKKEETRLIIKQLILVKKIALLLAFTFNYVNGLTNKMSSLMAYNSLYKTTYLLKSICLVLLSILKKRTERNVKIKITVTGVITIRRKLSSV